MQESLCGAGGHAATDLHLAAAALRLPAGCEACVPVRGGAEGGATSVQPQHADQDQDQDQRSEKNQMKSSRLLVCDFQGPPGILNIRSVSYENYMTKCEVQEQQVSSVFPGRMMVPLQSPESRDWDPSSHLALTCGDVDMVYLWCLEEPPWIRLEVWLILFVDHHYQGVLLPPGLYFV